MAKLKSSARAKRASAKSAGLQSKADLLQKSLVESAQQIWLAGVGAFGRAQEEGTKLFEALVKEGMALEQTTRKLAGGKVDAVRDVVEDRVGQVRERAADTWDRLEKVFEERVQKAMNRLGVPGRDELQALIDRVDALNGELRKLGKTPKPAAPARKPAAKKAPAKRAPAKKATAKKTRRSRPAPPKAPKPVAPGG